MKVHSTKILAICLIAAIAYIYYQDKQHATLVADTRQLSEQLEQANALLLVSEEKIALLEKESIEGMLKETNKVMVSGWETLLDTVKDELTKAKERFNAEGFTLERLKSDKEKKSNSGVSSSPQSSGPGLPESKSPDTSGSSDAEQDQPTIEGERT